MSVISTVGSRKTSVARVYMKESAEGIFVNNRPVEEYFPVEMQRAQLLDPFSIFNLNGNFSLKIFVKGGGINGQMEAARLAISKALCVFNGDFRKDLKKSGFLRRDPRKVERKKFGRKKARKSFQFTKR